MRPAPCQSGSTLFACQNKMVYAYFVNGVLNGTTSYTKVRQLKKGNVGYNPVNKAPYAWRRGCPAEPFHYSRDVR